MEVYEMEKKKHHRFLGKYDGYKYEWFRTAKEFVIIFLIVVVIFNVFIGVSRVDGNSMEPTLQNGDVVFFLRMGSDYQDGDVVFARMPSGEYYVKRVIATEGEVVDLKDGIFYIDGVQEEGDYILGITEAQDGIVSYPYTVEKGKYFMVGDNRERSMDSRSFGALLESSIKGKLILR